MLNRFISRFTIVLAASAILQCKAFAQNTKQPIFFDIPKTTIDRALNHLGQQANVPVLFPFSHVQYLKSNSVHGYHTIERALACIIQGSKLASKITSQGAVVITVNDGESPTSPAPDTLQANTCLGVVEKVSAIEETPPAMANSFSLEEIIVTSRRFNETLKDSPMSVTSVSGESLRNRAEVNISAISQLSPNINFTTAGAVSGSTSAAVIYIRGVGQNDYVPVIDPSVGVYVDDVYYGRSIGAAFNLIDAHQIEVLRGPQGALFGRNTIGGAISVKTNDPSGDQSGQLKITVGDQGRREGYLDQNLVLGSRLNAKISLARLKFDGTVKRINVAEADKLGDEDSYGARSKLEWNVSDQLRLLLAADYNREREQSAPEVNLQFRENAALPALWNGFSAESEQNAPQSTASGCVAGQIQSGVDCYNNRFLLGPFETAETSLSRNNVDSWGTSFLAQYAPIDQSWTSQILVAHRELEAFLARQVDGSPLDLFENRESYFSEQTSIDLRFRGDLEWAEVVGGFYYFTEKSDNQLDLAGVLNTRLFPIHIGGQTENQNFSTYAMLDIDVNDRSKVSVGLRYTDEVKRATPNAFRFVGCDIDLAPLMPSDCADGSDGYLVPNVEQENSLSKVTWSASYQYDINSQTNAYLSASSGFRSGGFEWRVINESVQELAILQAQNQGLARQDAERFVLQNGALPSFEPETLRSYEIGLKSEIPNKALRYSFALFDARYKNQIVATNTLGVATLQTNAAESSLRGAEFEAFWVSNSHWTFELSAGYLNAHYKKLTRDALNAGLTLDDRLIFAPKFNLALGINYSLDFPWGSFIHRVDANHKSSQEFEPVNSKFARDEGHTTFDFGVRYIPKSKKWNVAAGVKNVNNELYKVSGDANNVIGYENVIYARPRNAYLSLSYIW